MSTPQTTSSTPVQGGLTIAIALAQLLDQLDHAPRGADAAQYRAVVASLSRELTHFDGETLEPLLRASPAAAEVYENLHYAHAGLCRSDLDSALKAELMTRDVIRKAAEIRSGESRS